MLTWGRVNEECEDGGDQSQQNEFDDEPLVVAPQHQSQTLERLDEPHQRRIRTTARMQSKKEKMSIIFSNNTSFNGHYH